MAIVQLSKIHMRAGTEISLPGAPKTLTPLVFTPALDPAEFAYLTDTGRLFIGHDPKVGQANYNRTTFPYQNIEVLTENSTAVFEKLIGTQIREFTAANYYQAFLQASVGSWQDVLYTSDTNAPIAYTFDSKILLASIEYFIISQAGDPIRQGQLHILQDSIAAEATIVESRVSALRTDVDATVDPVGAERNVEFRIYRSGIGDDQHLRFSYRNSLAVAATMYFRVSRPL